jgi:hypothetical protein
LENNQWTNKFFSIWFSNMDSFTRVHDKKLAIAAITSLLTLQADHVPVSVQQGWPRLLQGIVRLFQTLPAALKNREEVTKEDDFASAGAYDDEDEEEWEGGEADWNEDGDEAEDVRDENTAYLDFLNEEAQKFTGDDDFDDLEEEQQLETPLDKLEPYGLFKNALMRLQQEQPQLYENLTKNLTPEEQQVVQSAVNQADTIAHAEMLAQRQAQLEAQQQEIQQQQQQQIQQNDQLQGQVHGQVPSPLQEQLLQRPTTFLRATESGQAGQANGEG